MRVTTVLGAVDGIDCYDRLDELFLMAFDVEDGFRSFEALRKAISDWWYDMCCEEHLSLWAE